MTFDVQGGGKDLIFPHHEMSAAQASVVTSQWPFARHYVHSGMVGWQGHKMSKSRGNLVFVSTLRNDGVDPVAIRLALLAHHYRSDWTWTEHGLMGANDRLELWRLAFRAPSGPEAEPVLERVREHLSNDMRTPEALDSIDRWALRVVQGEGTDVGAPQLVEHLVDALLGVRLSVPR
jgi:L-cysteine:1D-myo-inositol 2-amino-2-deoxy-alpha-D-glucopyranoside ligase